MKPTLDDLRKLAEAAKAWRPDAACYNETMYGDEPDYPRCRVSTPCYRCLGAKRAAEDVAELVRKSLYMAEKLTGRTGVFYRADHASEKAARIESYFGAPGVVAAFAAAVLEFCS